MVQGKNNPNALAGTVMGFNSLSAAPPFSRAELYELWFRQEFFDKKLIVRIGKSVPTYDFNNVVRADPAPRSAEHRSRRSQVRFSHRSMSTRRCSA